MERKKEIKKERKEEGKKKKEGKKGGRKEGREEGGQSNREPLIWQPGTLVLYSSTWPLPCQRPLPTLCAP